MAIIHQTMACIGLPVLSESRSFLRLSLLYFPVSSRLHITARSPPKNIGILRNTAWLCLFLTLSLLPAGMSRAAWLAVITGSLVVLCHHYSP